MNTKNKQLTVELFQDTRRGWRWRAVHGNGKILAASSESFKSRANAKRNLLALQKALAGPLTIEVLE